MIKTIYAIHVLCFVGTMNFGCNFSENDSDCSSSFEGIHIAVTILHACYAATVILVSMPICFILLAAMIKYQRFMDNSAFLVESILISDIATAIFLSSQVLITAAARAWLFGYWGCQVFAALSVTSMFSRWFAIGFLSLDRFSRVFFTFSYPRVENKVIVVLIILTWLLAIAVPIVVYFFNGLGFNKLYPACNLVMIISETIEASNVSIATVLVTIAVVFNTVAPLVLYTAMYFKGRKIRRATRSSVPQPADQQDPPTNSSWPNRANVTYGLLVFTIAFYSGTYIVRDSIIQFHLSSKNSTLIAVVLYLASCLIQSAVIADILILLRNREDRKLFRKFFYKDLLRLKCIQDT